MVVKRKREVEGEWVELRFERTGGGVKFSSPTLRVNKYNMSLYHVDLRDGDKVRIFQNGSRVGIVVDSDGPKKVKGNKNGTKFTISGKKIIKDLGLKVETTLAGERGEIQGKPAWIFA